MTAARDNPPEVACSTCGKPGVLDHSDELGHLIRHPGTFYLCRVALGDPAAGRVLPFGPPHHHLSREDAARRE